MNRRSTFLLIFVGLICVRVAVGLAEQQRIIGTIADAAPVTIVPEPGRTPLATLAEGTQVQILGPEENGWYRITFQDNYLLGDRVGYVRAEHVRIGVVLAPGNPAPTRSRAARGGLTESSIVEAITAGQQRKSGGLRLLDNGRRWTTTSGARSRMRLQIYTPLGWIQQLSADAAAASRPFTIKDVTDEMTQPVMRIAVYAEMSGALNGADAPWVRHVLLRADGMTAVRPITTMPFSEHVLSAAGGSSIFQGLRTTFALDAVRRLRGARGENDLVIALIGPRGDEKVVRISREQLQDLPM